MELPARFGKYELLEFLGGGMSQVYRARDTVIGRTVAVKILTPAGCEDPDVKARFLAEAQTAGNVEHENILSIYDFGEDEHRRPFMVMEFLRGESLAKAIQGDRTGDLRNKLRIALQLARALGHVHTLKIIHRDVKPENVQITTTGTVKLMDFGIAKTEGLSMTRTGYVVGTPRFMAPEQVNGQGVSEQVDVYAFGVVLFELVCGTNPIHGDTLQQIFYQILNEPIGLGPLRACGAPESVCDLVERCTRKNPAERPQGFGPVCADLERIIAGIDAPTVAIPKQEPVRAVAETKPISKWLVPAIVGLVVILLGVGLYLAFRPKAGVVVGPGPEPPKKEELAQRISAPGGDMVLVPAGEFQRGKDKTTDTLPAIYIDRTEVTNAAYRQFSEEKGHPLPAGFPQDRPDLPVVNVTIDDARAFAAWAGKRLPNAREWEKAARGTDGRIFPWGNELDMSRANLGGQGLRPVTDLTEGKSPCGALNMLGNAYEIVDEAVVPSERALDRFKNMNPPATRNEPWTEIRGLSYVDRWEYAGNSGLWDSGSVPARFHGAGIGFRCAKPLATPPSP